MYRFPRNDRLPDDRTGDLDYRDIQAEEERRAAAGRWPLLLATDRVLRWQDRYPDTLMTAARVEEAVSLPGSNVVALHANPSSPAPTQENSAEAASSGDSLVARPG